jgi:hypothetical protein
MEYHPLGSSGVRVARKPLPRKPGRARPDDEGAA